MSLVGSRYRGIGDIADALRETATLRSSRSAGKGTALTAWRFGGRLVVEDEDVDHRRHGRGAGIARITAKPPNSRPTTDTETSVTSGDKPTDFPIRCGFTT
jgi:hypothetical protein